MIFRKQVILDDLIDLIKLKADFTTLYNTDLKFVPYGLEEGVTCSAKALVCTVDLPAKAGMLCMNHHNGKFSYSALYVKSRVVRLLKDFATYTPSILRELFRRELMKVSTQRPASTYF